MCSNKTDKVCTSCNIDKSLEAFARKGLKDGYQIYETICKKCRAEYFKKRRKKILGFDDTHSGERRELYQAKIDATKDDFLVNPSKEAIEEWIRKFKLKKYQQTI